MPPDYIALDDINDLNRKGDRKDRASRMRHAESRRPDRSTFLSYSSADRVYVPAIVKILEDEGAMVYVDKLDPELAQTEGAEDASVLRHRIGVCRRFVVFLTANTRKSRWVPWELGVSDGDKGSQRTAIFPAVNSMFETGWTRQEYFAAYDRIVFGAIDGLDHETWMVRNHRKNTAIPLRDWLRD